MNDHINFVDRDSLAAILAIDVAEVARLESEHVFPRFPMDSGSAINAYIAHRHSEKSLHPVALIAEARGIVMRWADNAEMSIIRHIEMHGLCPDLVSLLADVRAARSTALETIANAR